MAALSELKDKPAGTIRITSAEHVADMILWPKLSQLAAAYPDIRIELNINYGFTDIVANKFDAGVRLGDQVEKDMIAVRISPGPSSGGSREPMVSTPFTSSFTRAPN